MSSFKVPKMDTRRLDSDLSLKKRRGIIACTRCRTRKVRCNVQNGFPCHNCQIDKIPCSIPEPKRKRSRFRKEAYRLWQSSCEESSYEGPREGSEMRRHQASSPMACPSSHPTVSAPQYPECSNSIMTPSASSESVGVDADEQIAEWILSCPISLGTELPVDLLSTLISISTGTGEYPQGSTPPGPIFRKCLKHINNAIAGRPTGQSTAQSTAQSAKECHVEDLAKISNNLLTLSQKLCDTLRCSVDLTDLHCLSEAPKSPEAPKKPRGIIEAKGWWTDDQTIENNQWDSAGEYILPYGFDSVMELWNSQTT